MQAEGPVPDNVHRSDPRGGNRSAMALSGVFLGLKKYQESRRTRIQ